MQSETRFLGSDIKPICELKLWSEWKVTSASRRLTKHWRCSLIGNFIVGGLVFVTDALTLQYFHVRTRQMREWAREKCLIEKPLTAHTRWGFVYMLFNRLLRRWVRWQAETIWHISAMSLKRTSPRCIEGAPPCVKDSVSHASTTVLRHSMEIDMKTRCKVEHNSKLWMLCVWAVMEVIVALASHVQHGNGFCVLGFALLACSHGRIIYHSQRNPILVLSFAGFYFAVSPFHHRRLDYFFCLGVSRKVDICFEWKTLLSNPRRNSFHFELHCIHHVAV